MPIVNKEMSFREMMEVVSLQAVLGTYKATPREVPFGTWVWVSPSFGEAAVLGIVVELEKKRGANGQTSRVYTVVHSHGQSIYARELMLLATEADVNKFVLKEIVKEIKPGEVVLALI